MPVHSRFYPTRSLIITRATGDISGSDIFRNRRELAEDPRFHPGLDHLVDLTRVRRFDLSTGEIRRLASLDLFSDASRRVVVAPADLTYGLSRMYAGYREPPDHAFHICRGFEDAVRWLARNLDGARPGMVPFGIDDRTAPLGTRPFPG